MIEKYCFPHLDILLEVKTKVVNLIVNEFLKIMKSWEFGEK